MGGFSGDGTDHGEPTLNWCWMERKLAKIPVIVADAASMMISQKLS